MSVVAGGDRSRPATGGVDAEPGLAAPWVNRGRDVQHAVAELRHLAAGDGGARGEADQLGPRCYSIQSTE